MHIAPAVLIISFRLVKTMLASIGSQIVVKLDTSSWSSCAEIRSRMTFLGSTKQNSVEYIYGHKVMQYVVINICTYNLHVTINS